MFLAVSLIDRVFAGFRVFTVVLLSVLVPSSLTFSPIYLFSNTSLYWRWHWERSSVHFSKLEIFRGVANSTVEDKEIE